MQSLDFALAMNSIQPFGLLPQFEKASELNGFGPLR